MKLESILVTLAALATGATLSACDAKSDAAKPEAADQGAHAGDANANAKAHGEGHGEKAKAEASCGGEGKCAPGACGADKKSHGDEKKPDEASLAAGEEKSADPAGKEESAKPDEKPET